MSFSHIALAILVAVIWGLCPLSCKLISNAHFPPTMMIALRFLGASLPIIFFLKKPKIPLTRLMLVSLALSCNMLFFMFAIKENIGAGLASILEESQVFFTIFLSYLILGYRLVLRDIILLMIGFMGIVLIGVDMGLGGGDLWVFALLLAAAFAWALNNIHLSSLKKDPTPISTIVWASFIPSIPFLGASYFYEQQAFLGALDAITLKSILLIFFMSFISGSVALWIWSYLLRHNNPVHVAAFALLSPLVGVLSSSCFCGEILTTATFWGGILILSSLIFLQISTHQASLFLKK